MSRARERALLAQAPEALPPVFIVGLHRSGTTFLYEVLRDLLPLSCVTAFRVLRYPELLSLAADHRLPGARQELAQRFHAWGLGDRQIDAVALRPDMPEEYGWILAHARGRLTLGPRTEGVFGELCRKLAVLEPGHTPLLKNPWDTAQVPWIAARLPRARFVFIDRDPLRVLQSQLGAAVVNAGYAPYLDLLLARFRLGRAALAGQRLLLATLGRERFRRVMLRGLARDVVAQRAHFARAADAVEPTRQATVRYEDLIQDPARALEPVLELLELPLRAPLASVAPRPRQRPLDPLVETQAWRFR
ncbi:MAG: sulfotransferase [Planctomycetota bacterium]